MSIKSKLFDRCECSSNFGLALNQHSFGLSDNARQNKGVELQIGLALWDFTNELSGIWLV